MENITPDEVRQIDMDRLASKMAEVRHDGEYVDVLDKSPQLGCAYVVQLDGQNLGCCLCVRDRPSNEVLFVSANGSGLIGGVKEKTMLYSDNRITLTVPDLYELDEDWMFRGILFKIDLDKVKRYDCMIKLLK